MVLIQEIGDVPEKKEKVTVEMKKSDNVVEKVGRKKFTLILDNADTSPVEKKPISEAEKRLAAELDDEEKAKNYPRLVFLKGT